MTLKTAKHHATARVADSYLACVRAFPLRPIRTEAEYREALEILGRLASREGLDAGEGDYLAALAHFVGDYERNAVKLKLHALKPLEALRYLMEQNNMTTTDLGYVLGSRGLASEVLNGKRGLSKMMIGRLAERFAVEAGLFLG